MFVEPEARRVLAQLARTALVLLDGDHLGGGLGEQGRLAAGRRAEVEDPLAGLRADGEAGQLRAAALRPDEPVGKPLLRDLVDRQGSRELGVALAGEVSTARGDPDDRRRRLVLASMSASAVSRPCSRHKISAIQSG